MPIKINLLAEAKIAEDLRRRDPVKRAVFVGGLLVVLALVWSSTLELDVMVSKSKLSQLQGEIEEHTNAWQNVLVNQAQVSDIKAKLDALQHLSNARFLQGTFLNALQHLTLDGVQLTRVKVDQSYALTPGAAGHKDDDGHFTPGRPSTVTEKILVSMDARDFSPSPGGLINKFKETIASQDYFKSVLNNTNAIQLVSLSSPQNWVDGRPYVLFTLECNFPPQTR